MKGFRYVEHRHSMAAHSGISVAKGSYRSAISGRYISGAAAARHPRTSVTETGTTAARHPNTTVTERD